MPVTREELVFERRPAGRDPSDRAEAPGEGAERQLDPGEALRVPVIEEEVVVEKRPVVAEEVVVGKREVQDTEQVSGTVRREEPVVRTRGDVNVRGDVGATGADRAAALSRALSDRGFLLGLGARSLAAIGLGLGVGWLYRRWRREQDRPLNRLRRTLRGATS